MWRGLSTNSGLHTGVSGSNYVSGAWMSSAIVVTMAVRSFCCTLADVVGR